MAYPVKSSHGGHHGKNMMDPGALNADGTKEAVLVQEINKKFLGNIAGCGDASDFMATNTTQNLYNIVANMDRQAGPSDYSLSHHFNAFNRQATGVEVWYYAGDSAAGNLAATISKAIANALGVVNRGAKPTANLYVISASRSHALLIEWCFIDNNADLAKWRANGDKAINAVLQVLGYKGNTSTGGGGNVSNNYKVIPNESHMNHVPNMIGEQKDGKYIKAVIKKVPTEKMASGMVGFIREHTSDILTNGNIFGLDYPNRRMLKFVGLTRKQANDWKAEVTRLAQGQYVNYSASNVKVVNAADGKTAWIEVDNLSKNDAAFTRLRNNLRAKYVQEILGTRISYKKESDGTYTVSVINIETMDRAKEIVRRLRRWHPGATNAYDDAVAVLQY